jgi:DNA-binding MarR family transcriptional regulator
MRELLRMREESGIEDNEEVSSLLEAYLLTGDCDLYEAIEMRIKHEWAKKIASDDPFDQPEPESLGNDGVMIGRLKDSGLPFYWLEEDINKGLLISGDIGSGKTNAAMYIASGLHKKGCSIWIYDPRFDYVSMIRAIPRLLRVPWERLRFNVLKPPENVPVSRWSAVFADCFCHVYGLWIASSNFLLDCLAKLYKLYDGTGFWPSLYDLDLFLASLNLRPMSKDEMYRDTIRDRTRAIISMAGQIFSCNTGFDFDGLSWGSDMLFDFSGCPEQLRQFLTYMLMHYVYLYRQYSPNSGGYLPLIHILDESRGLILQRKTDYVSDIDHLATRSRPFNISYIYIEQLLSQVSQAITSNTRLKLVFNSQGRELLYAREILGLTWDQVKALRKLPVGTCIAVLGGDRCTKPLLLEIPRFESDGISKEEVESWTERSLELLNRSVTERSSFLEELIKRSKAEKEGYLTPDERRLLRDVNSHPFLFISERRERLGLSWQKINTALSRLERKGFIELIPVNLGKRGQPPKLLELKPKALEWLKREGEPISKFVKGGIVHAYWSWRIASSLEKKGYKTELEAELKPGLFCDCLARADSRVIAIEVECSDNGLRNVEKYLPFIDFIEVIVAVDGKVEKLKSGLETLEPELNNKLRIVDVRDLVSELDE